jgi:hypothetical protein
MWRRALLMACVTAALASPEAGAVTPLRPLGLADGAVVTDGARYAAYDPVPGVTRIIDTRAEGSRVIARPDGCRTAALGAGQLLWGCDVDCGVDRRWEKAVLYDLRSGIVRDGPLPEGPPCSSRASDDGQRSVVAIGRHWLAYAVGAYHVTVTAYVDRADRHGLRESEDARVAVDLDAPSGQVHMCSPMRREYNDMANLVSNTYRPFAYRAPWGLTTAGGDEHTDTDELSLLLHRCGRRPVRISDCPNSCLRPSLGAGIATWATGRNEVWALRVATGRRRRWKVGGVSGVAHTRDRLFVSTTRYINGSEEVERRAYSASLKGLLIVR